eukprot:2238037-Pyramimonas_sp.AAC.1
MSRMSVSSPWLVVQGCRVVGIEDNQPCRLDQGRLYIQTVAVVTSRPLSRIRPPPLYRPGLT